MGDDDDTAAAADSFAGGRRWSLRGTMALVTGGTRGIGYVGTNFARPTTEYTAGDYERLMASHQPRVRVPPVPDRAPAARGVRRRRRPRAMNQLAKNLAREWAKDGIKVNSVAPWYIKTPLVQGVS
ncbi:hypothetical protein BS78_K040200 [Paspalum vaginatum]|uniref:Uncharacterized protein n=1 Tax=Paspalum vaginatum TaxID=158149 RepID=A0A9W7X758_9POAL|nr:hypothetical protein BS78_K040200 [Paspalum vaginatum]